MLLVRGTAAGTELTGTLYERGDQAPSFRGAPDEGAAYTWVCDEFYEVESGGLVQPLADRDVRVAFEEPVARGFETREAALAAAREHIRTQFARLGVDSDDVDIEAVEAEGVAPAE